MRGKPHPGSANRLSLFLLLLGGQLCSEAQGQPEPGQELRGSLAGERAAQELKRALTNETYNIHWGPVRFQTEARIGATYTDNVFLSQVNRRDDYIIHPEANLSAWMPVGELNVLRASVGLGYEWFAKNHSLNSDVPLVSPGSELLFYLFVGDFRIKVHDKASYEQTLTYNESAGDQPRFFNFNDVARFDRFDNFAGFAVDWDLNKVIISASYDHENFISTTERFKYLDRASEWLTADVNYLLGDRSKAGLEARFGFHNYDEETILNDNWRVRAGPFFELKLPAAMILRTGGGYDAARFDETAAPGNDYDNWYAYGKISQELKWFVHSLAAGHETLLGDNANNLRTTYVRYSISSDAIKNLELEGHFSVNFSKEFGGVFFEEFTHYLTGVRVGYPFHKYFRVDLAYELFLKDSETADRSFHRNQVSLDVIFRF